jgi:hypothetical protein
MIPIGRPQGQQQAGDAALGRLETQRGQVGAVGHGAVAAGGDDIVGDAGAAAQHLQVGGGETV